MTSPIPTPIPTPILLADPRVAAVPVRETYQPLVALGAAFGPVRARVRAGLAARLRLAQLALPAGLRLCVVEGHRSAVAQRAIIADYAAQCGLGVTAPELSRFVAPLAVAPHVAGAAVDITLVNGYGDPLDLGTLIDATPEESGGRCYFDAVDIPARARKNRDVLARALSGAGLVNYPTEWWHWSYGDRYWALMTGEPAALYGPVDDLDGPDFLGTRYGDAA